MAWERKFHRVLSIHSRLGTGDIQGVENRDKAWDPPGFLLFLGEFIQWLSGNHPGWKKPPRVASPHLVTSPEHWVLQPAVPWTLPGNYFMEWLNSNPKKIPQHQDWYKIREYKPCYRYKTALKVRNNTRAGWAGVK